MTPKILLSTSRDDPRSYVEMIMNCGGDPIAAYCPEYMDEYDGLLLTGGVDVHPSLYGEPVNGSVNMDPQRDAAEMALIRAFLDAGKPIFGVCRGHQLLNVFFGGTLHQHINSAAIHSPAQEGVYLAHDARAIPGSICYALYGEHFPVNSHHHQAVKVLAPGLKSTMFSTDGTIVEAFEHEALPVFAVQWHPEKMCFACARPDTVDGAPIARHFMELCKKVLSQNA